jgi:peroxiredoxin
MRVYRVVIILLISVILSNVTNGRTKAAERGYIVTVGDKAPDFEIKLIDGSIFKLSEQRGKIVMLQFTASWCGVCRKEMPFIESEIWQKLKNKNFVVLGVDKEEPIEKVIKYVEQTKVTYPFGLDDSGDVFNKYAHKDAGITRNVVIDENGIIIYQTRLFSREEFDKMKKVIFDKIK